MKNYFSGMYFKQRGQNGTVALIPAIHCTADGRKRGSIQLVTEQENHCIWLDGHPVQNKKGEYLLADSRFSSRGVHLEAASDGVIAAGDLRFRNLTEPQTGAMGALRLLPFLECRHAVYSMRHAVDGCLTINGKTYFFDGGEGYMEGDAGRSFPRKYLWTQCLFGRGSVMISAAEIPYLGMRFTGVLAMLLYQGKQYRLASDCGAHIVHLEQGRIAIRQKNLFLSAELLSQGGAPLKAPRSGAMTRTIREQLRCCARYRFAKDGRTLFAFESNRASFESEWGTEPAHVRN